MFVQHFKICCELKGKELIPYLANLTAVTDLRFRVRANTVVVSVRYLMLTWQLEE